MASVVKIKLKDIIEKLQIIREEYKKEFGKEPQILGMDSFDSEIESIELCHSYREYKVGGYTVDDIKEFYLWAHKYQKS